MNLPTWITVSRLLGLPLILYLLTIPTEMNRWFAVGIFVLAASTDWLDGYLARKLNLVTELGKFLDPLVDKLLTIGALIALVELNLVPAWGVCLILARELTIAGWRVNPNLTGSTKISGANLWGKAKTVVQIIAIAIIMAPLSENWAKIGLGLFWISVGLTLISGWIYIAPNIFSSKEKSISDESRPEAE